MGHCSVCGEFEEMDYTCTYCGKLHCTTHRLPESHDCPALDHFGEISKRLQSDTDAKRTTDPSQADQDSTPRDPPSEAGVERPNQPGPEPMETVRTHGGSGRDREKANFSRSPDVKPDGSLDRSGIEGPEQNDTTAEETNSLLWNHLNDYIVPYGLLVVVLLALQFGLGVDMIGFAQQYFPGL